MNNNEHKRPLLLFVGRSGSGKTTVADELALYSNYKIVQSYTTRPPRYPDETGHIFVSKDEFNKLEEFAAYTMYNNYEYATTFKQLSECDIYVIDVPGVETLISNISKINRPIYTFYFDASVVNRIERMKKRGDDDSKILDRLLQDDSYDWYDRLDTAMRNCPDDYDDLMVLININANQSLPMVITDVKKHLPKTKEF